MVLKKWLSKQYKDEMHIIDGVIISILMIVFIISNITTLTHLYFIDLVLILGMIITVFLISVLTIKNVFIHIDEMQISLSFLLSVAITLFNQFFFVGIVAYWIFFAYFMTFIIVCFRNLILKLYYDKKDIRW